jgi:phosphoenolpyruvate carboxykinase (ATP)
MSLTHTRAIVDAIHDGSLAKVDSKEDPIFGVHIPTSCPGVPAEVLTPKNTWSDDKTYEATAKKLAHLFQENFKKYADVASKEIRGAGPRI